MNNTSNDKPDDKARFVDEALPDDTAQLNTMTSLSITPTKSLESVALDWARLLEEHRRWLTTVVRSRLANPTAVEDVLQEIALAVWQQASRPVELEKVPAFLYRIAIRKVVNHHRVHGRRKRLMDGYVSQISNDAGLDMNRPGEWLFQREQSENFQAVFEKINSKDRELLMLKYSEGWNYRQLANHLGVSIKTIEYRLLRARQSLRAALTLDGDL